VTQLPPAIAAARILAQIGDLLRLPAETTWVEFKHNNSDPTAIGKLISALSNAARLADQHFAYVLWGVNDGDRTIVGTTFEPSAQTEQQQPLDFWLAQRLAPAPVFSFKPVEFQGEHLIMLEIVAAATSPVEFDRTAYVRIGSATPRLSDHPERLKSLWSKLQPYVWESGVAAQFLTGDEVLNWLDYTSYFSLTQQPLPDNRDGIFEKLIADRLIQADVGKNWSILNLGAVLFAKRLADFSPSIARKGVRFVAYEGSSRTATVTHRQDGQRGYASGFERLMDYIHGLLPQNEHIGKALREAHPLYPFIALRELVANSLIHQDMTVTGSGPLVELFTDRLEITNPGEPLVSPDRFLDLPPRSRNEALAALMRRMRLCEEQGTGIDKVLDAVEAHHLPPPDFRMEGNAVRVVLFAPRSFARMTPEERIRACYQHAALKYINGQRMKNSSLCERLGIESSNAAQASTVIRQAQAALLIKPADLEHPRAGYVPFWA
jgi:ATP-dependent DNA helicase RecG